MQRQAGRSVLMAAGDTFRAAAAEQLDTWAERSGAEFVRGSEGGDPSSVIFDGVERAAARNIDLVLADTAGRLHTKTNLMDELRKVRRVASKGAGRVTEVLLVIDATTGQNGLAQAREFGDALTQTIRPDRRGADQARRQRQGRHRVRDRDRARHPSKLVGLGETIGDLVPSTPQSSSTPCSRTSEKSSTLGNRRNCTVVQWTCHESSVHVGWPTSGRCSSSG